MNLNSAFATAIIRAFYAALITGALAALTSYQTGAGTNEAIVTGLIAGLGVLAVRGGLEGVYDQARADANEQRPGDVGYDQLAKR